MPNHPEYALGSLLVLAFGGADKLGEDFLRFCEATVHLEVAEAEVPHGVQFKSGTFRGCDGRQ